MPDRINLVTGECALLSRLGYAVSILAATGIVTSASSWVWKGIALIVLAAVTGFIFRRAAESRSPGSITLSLDGTAVLLHGREEVLLDYTGHAWISSLFSVIHFLEADSGRKCSWLVCAANNHPDDYRRMLGYLRLGSGGAVQGSDA